MKRFRIKIIETLADTVEVFATNEEEAKDKVIDMYNNCEIVLEPDCFENVDFEVIEDDENKKQEFIDNEKYIPFILGYDLLRDYFKNKEDNECDIVFEECEKITNDFLKSKYNVPYKGLYECLQEYLNDNFLEV